jgi:predicted ester cyclase
MTPKTLFTTFLTRYSGKPKPQSELNQYMTDEGLKAHIAFFETAFPNYELQIEDLVEEGNKVVARMTFKGVHNGDFAGMAPTSKKVELPIIVMYEFENDKITNHWVGADQGALRAQLVAEPEMAF